MLCANAWGKALHVLEDQEEENSIVPKISPLESEADNRKAHNLCLRQGKIFTIDVRKIAERFK